MKKSALVLGGGGAKGYYELGALEFMIMEAGLDWDEVYGCSVGALIAAVLCMFPDIKDGFWAVKQIFMEEVKGTKSIYKSHWPGGKIGQFLGLHIKKSIVNAKPLVKLVNKLFNAEALKTSGRHLTVTTVELSSGKLKTFSTGHEFIKDAILASSSYPIYFPPVMINGKSYSDGGLIDVVPVRHAIDAEADIIDVVVTDSPALSKWKLADKPTVEQIGRFLGIMSNEMHINDLLTGKWGTDNIRFLVQPRKDIGSGTDFEKPHTALMYKKGYEDAKKVIG